MNTSLTKSVVMRTDHDGKILLSELEEFIAAAKEVGCLLDDVVSLSVGIRDHGSDSFFEMEIHP